MTDKVDELIKVILQKKWEMVQKYGKQVTRKWRKK